MNASRIHIVEVGPRDGLQNEKRVVPVAAKVEFITRLAGAGLKEIEGGAFVSPKRVSQMADSPEVFRRLENAHLPADVVLSALVPNEKGMDEALSVGVRKIAVFTAASETFNSRNINCTIAESFARFAKVLKLARENNVAVRGYVSTAFVCPYEGEIAAAKAAEVIRRFADLGVTDISIGDTIGKATNAMVQGLLEYLLLKLALPTNILAMHFHDTYGKALANVEVSLQHGISRFDASVGGLGGCPFAPGAPGNLSTNALVKFLHEQGMTTGIDPVKLDGAAQFIRSLPITFTGQIATK